MKDDDYVVAWYDKTGEHSLTTGDPDIAWDVALQLWAQRNISPDVWHKGRNLQYRD